MKYLALILLLCSCNAQQQKQPPKTADTLKPLTVVADTGAAAINTDDAYQTNTEDTARINATLDELIKLPRIHSLDSSIKQATNYKHGASFIVHTNFNDDTTYYHVTVGDNSHDDHYATLYHFVMNKQTGDVKFYDTAIDSLITLENWQKQNP